MVLVLCDIVDLGALWAARELSARGVEVDVVSSPVLESALRWVHRVGEDGAASIEIELFDGRRIGTDTTFGVLNRLSYVPPHRLQHVSSADSEYATQEMQALFLSWLHCLRGPVLNPPSPQGLGGQWRHDSQWRALAAGAGLATLPYRQGSAEPTANGARPHGPTVTAFAVGSRTVVLPIVPAEVTAGCARLARMAGATLLGVDLLAPPAGRWEMVGATATPYLPAGGPLLVDALIEALGQ